MTRHRDQPGRQPHRSRTQPQNEIFSRTHTRSSWCCPSGPFLRSRIHRAWSRTLPHFPSQPVSPPNQLQAHPPPIPPFNGRRVHAVRSRSYGPARTRLTPFLRLAIVELSCVQSSPRTTCAGLAHSHGVASGAPARTISSFSCFHARAIDRSRSIGEMRKTD